MHLAQGRIREPRPRVERRVLNRQQRGAAGFVQQRHAHAALDRAHAIAQRIQQVHTANLQILPLVLFLILRLQQIVMRRIRRLHRLSLRLLQSGRSRRRRSSARGCHEVGGGSVERLLGEEQTDQVRIVWDDGNAVGRSSGVP
ncbi:hypothetical protein BC936DRAFT_137352 [Jimgerdemannia flammicorona]|uniref:Uncharacterized protein n=1 Tax=Jimgerdemannia flammicorona TaxID=994334 RepID=A0A433CXK3_9FUNG|nr:hypothetical protein BC936DRAFT_137352 [Jimgerdemannia flammicorona]